MLVTSSSASWLLRRKNSSDEYSGRDRRHGQTNSNEAYNVSPSWSPGYAHRGCVHVRPHRRRVSHLLAVFPGALDDDSQGLERRLSHHRVLYLSLIHISEPTRLGMISYAVFCLKKKKKKK